MTMLTITPVYVALNVALFIVLAFAVVHYRIENQVSLGNGGLATLERAIRAHGNLAEYAPFALILLAILELNGLAPWQLHLFGAAFLGARMLHAVGIFKGAIAPRSAGALLSMVLLMAMAGRGVVLIVF